MGRVDKWLVVAAALGSAAAAVASETITYTYDSRGRVTKVARSGTVNDGVSTSYTYDKADNRTNKTTTGVGAALLSAPVVVEETPPAELQAEPAPAETSPSSDEPAIDPGSSSIDPDGRGR